MELIGINFNRNGDLLGNMDEGFESGTEITFNCIRGAAGDRTTWKITCDDGEWSGRSFDCSTASKFLSFRLYFKQMVKFSFISQQMALVCFLTMNQMS